MATKPKYTGVTPVDPTSSNPAWQYRLKVKIDGKQIDTKIKKDLNGNPFLTARAAYEAKKAHEERLRAAPTGTASEPIITTLSDVYNNYLLTEAKFKAPATLRKQDSMWINHIQPLFGDRDINSITIIELETFLFDLYQTHAYKYVEGFLRFFYLLFGHADRMEVIDPVRYNRMFVSRNTHLEMPEKTQIDHEDDLEGATVFDDSDLYSIEKVFKSEDGNLLMSFYLGLYCGLRISECFGLRWSNINWSDGTIKIDRQLQYIDGQLRLAAVKTLTSSRTVIIPTFLYEELEFYYSQQQADRERLGQSYRDTERVYDELTKQWLVGADFVNRKKNGELLTVNSMKYWSKKIKADLGIDFKYHYLRHTYASRCALSNLPIFLLMSYLGHKKIDTTKKYYINVDSDYAKKHSKKLIDQMYNFRNLGIDIRPIDDDN